MLPRYSILIGLNRNRHLNEQAAISNNNHRLSMNVAPENYSEKQTSVKRPHNFKDISGSRFGRLTVVCYLRRNKHSNSIWNCKCDCGSIIEVNTASLKSGNTSSCGCYQIESVRKNMTTHGKCNLKEYSVWAGMIQRCANPKRNSFKDYGGRGISVCERWKEFESFFCDMGVCPDGFTLDRKNNNGNYDPGNVRWAEQKEQSRNTRRNIFICIDGKTKTAGDWGVDRGFPVGLVTNRINHGWSRVDAVNTPYTPRRK